MITESGNPRHSFLKVSMQFIAEELARSAAWTVEKVSLDASRANSCAECVGQSARAPTGDDGLHSVTNLRTRRSFEAIAFADTG